MAEYCCMLNTGMDALDGLMLIETSDAPITVIWVELETPSYDAVMVALPEPTPLARPLSETVATDGALVIHDTEVVRSSLLPLVKVPVAVNCWIVPREIEGFAGAIAMEESTNCPTLAVAEAETWPSVAEMVTEPSEALVARPADPGELPTIAMLVALELQVTRLVKFCVVPSLKVPVAMNCWVAPRGMEAEGGLMAMETRTLEVTVNDAVALMLPLNTVIVAAPELNAVAWPCEPEASLMVATVGADEVQ